MISYDTCEWQHSDSYPPEFKKVRQSHILLLIHRLLNFQVCYIYLFSSLPGLNFLTSTTICTRPHSYNFATLTTNYNWTSTRQQLHFVRWKIILLAQVLLSSSQAPSPLSPLLPLFCSGLHGGIELEVRLVPPRKVEGLWGGPVERKELQAEGLQEKKQTHQ